MTKLPSMPMFWAEFFADTQEMSGESAKAYLFLLGHAWLRGAKLPDDDAALARMARTTPSRWATIKPVVMSFWVSQPNNEGWTQKRLKKEWEYLSRKREQLRIVAHAGGKASAAKREAISTDAPKQTVNQPTPTPIREERKKDVSTRHPKKAVAKRPPCAVRLATDFRPSEAMRAHAKAKGLTDEWIDAEGEAMRDWSLSSEKGKKLDWEATWRGWVKRKLETKGNGSDARQGRKGSLIDAGLDLLRAMPSEDSGEIRDDVVRMLQDRRSQ